MKIELTMTTQDIHDLVVAIVALIGAISGLITTWNHAHTSVRVTRNTRRIEDLEKTNGAQEAVHP